MSAGATEPARRGRVEVSGLGRFPALRGAGLARWLERLLAELAPEADSLAIRFVGDRAMRELNRRYRGLDATTDVLSFPGAASPEGRHLGDVVVSVPQATRQAEARGHRAAREIRLLALHGVLHCLGYDHETDGGEMERLERRLRRRFLDHA
ncbi:MAG: rRNA maturation RNase YbeY [Thermoanaerobaculia bacterium]|nr:MAG: rRNA maturation RNase YbeY [Thermoanaerobaculia bacterium]